MVVLHVYMLGNRMYKQTEHIEILHLKVIRRNVYIFSLLCVGGKLRNVNNWYRSKFNLRIRKGLLRRSINIFSVSGFSIYGK